LDRTAELGSGLRGGEKAAGWGLPRLARLARRGSPGALLGEEAEAVAVSLQALRAVAFLAMESGNADALGEALDFRVIYGMELLGHAAASNGASIKPRLAAPTAAGALIVAQLARFASTSRKSIYFFTQRRGAAGR